MRVCVLVLGDLGQSVRMQYHALALAADGAQVDLIGYAGTTPYRAVREHADIHCHFLPPPRLRHRHRLPSSLFVAYSCLRTLHLWARSLYLLCLVVHKPDFVLVQNPPAIPTLFVSLLAARLRSAKLVVDWHNYSYTMLSLRLGPGHAAVRLTRWCEKFVGRRADAHFCVSRAMQADLSKNWGIDRPVLVYDRPAEWFEPTSLEKRHALFIRLQDDGAVPAGACRTAPEATPESGEGEETLITVRPRGQGLRLRPDRPALIMSSTSWTVDEDFGLLLEALSLMSKLIQSHDRGSGERPFPALLFLVTGEGPLRREFERKLAELHLERIQVCTLWLPAEDYAILLGAVDLGLCLHRSSSGFDLPIKLADMFGCGLPVCALDYGPCLAEQVHHGVNGFVFSDGAELAQQLYDLFKGFPQRTPLLDCMRRNVRLSSSIRWQDNWRKHALPVFGNP